MSNNINEIAKALKLEDADVRVVCDDRWLVWDKDSGEAGEWVVYGRKKHQQLTRTLLHSVHLNLVVPVLTGKTEVEY